MQLDSHMRLQEYWDTEFIKMLHSCDAGEYSVLTSYPAGFYERVGDDGSVVEMFDFGTLVRRWWRRSESGMALCGCAEIEQNEDWLVKPFETGCLGGGFVFSHGHYILNAGYSKEFSNVFEWEEPF